MFQFPPLTPFVKKLLIALGAIFILQVLLENWAGLPLSSLLALSPGTPDVMLLWQVATYPLVRPISPSSLLWLLVTMVFLWWMLAPFEMRFGTKRAVQLIVVSIFAASLPALLFGLVVPNATPLYGTGPLILGTLGASVWSVRHLSEVRLFGMFPMRPIHLVWGVVGITVIQFLITKSVVMLVADLGAIGGGIGFVHWMSRPPARRKPKHKKSPRAKAPFTVIEGGADDDERPRWLN